MDSHSQRSSHQQQQEEEEEQNNANSQSQPLPQIRDSARLESSSLDLTALPDIHISYWQLHRTRILWMTSLILCVAIGAWVSMNNMRPFAHDLDLSLISQQLIDPQISIRSQHADSAPDTTTDEAPTGESTGKSTDENTDESSDHSTAKITAANAPIWRPDSEALYWNPQDSPQIDSSHVRVFVVTISAKVTAYTPYDHAISHPEWADGIVAWHPKRRKRHVREHPYCLATDWTQFPGGATFIRVPGYMSKSFPRFPEAFRVVDDKCGRARRDNRKGRQPVIDVRYLTRHSAISGRGAWGMKNLDVEVIFPANFTIPASLQQYVVQAEWRTYHNGLVVETEIVQSQRSR